MDIIRLLDLLSRYFVQSTKFWPKNARFVFVVLININLWERKTKKLALLDFLAAHYMEGRIEKEKMIILIAPENWIKKIHQFTKLAIKWSTVSTNSGYESCISKVKIAILKLRFEFLNFVFLTSQLVHQFAYFLFERQWMCMVWYVSSYLLNISMINFIWMVAQLGQSSSHNNYYTYYGEWGGVIIKKRKYLGQCPN